MIRVILSDPFDDSFVYVKDVSLGDTIIRQQFDLNTEQVQTIRDMFGKQASDYELSDDVYPYVVRNGVIINNADFDSYLMILGVRGVLSSCILKSDLSVLTTIARSECNHVKRSDLSETDFRLSGTLTGIAGVYRPIAPEDKFDSYLLRVKSPKTIETLLEAEVNKSFNPLKVGVVPCTDCAATVSICSSVLSISALSRFGSKYSVILSSGNYIETFCSLMILYCTDRGSFYYDQSEVEHVLAMGAMYGLTLLDVKTSRERSIVAPVDYTPPPTYKYIPTHVCDELARSYKRPDASALIDYFIQAKNDVIADKQLIAQHEAPSTPVQLCIKIAFCAVMFWMLVTSICAYFGVADDYLYMMFKIPIIGRLFEYLYHRGHQSSDVEVDFYSDYNSQSSIMSGKTIKKWMSDYNADTGLTGIYDQGVKFENIKDKPKILAGNVLVFVIRGDYYVVQSVRAISGGYARIYCERAAYNDHGNLFLPGSIEVICPMGV